MIKKYFLQFVVALALAAGCLGLVVAVSPADVSAKSIISEACTFAPESETCKSDADAKQNPLTGTSGTLYKVSLIISVVAGIAAVIVIIVSGIRYMTSGGDSQKVSSAKNTMIGAIAGLLIIVLAQTIITFIVKRI